MNIKTLIPSILFAVILAGCTNTTNRYHAKNNTNSRLMARVVNIVDSEVRTANEKFSSQGYREYSKEYFQNLSSTPFGAAKVTVPKMQANLVKSSEQTMNIDLKVFTTHKLKYKSGHWLFDPLTGMTDPHTTVFIDAVSKIINKLNTQIRNSGYSMSINAVYTGGADAGRIKQPIPYSSKVGSISEYVTINDTRKEQISIRNGSYISSNAQLALVRAKSVSKAVDLKVAPIKLNNSYKIELSNMTGEEYRFVTVKLQIKK